MILRILIFFCHSGLLLPLSGLICQFLDGTDFFEELMHDLDFSVIGQKFLLVLTFDPKLLLYDLGRVELTSATLTEVKEITFLDGDGT